METGETAREKKHSNKGKKKEIWVRVRGGGETVRHQREKERQKRRREEKRER